MVTSPLRWLSFYGTFAPILISIDEVLQLVRSKLLVSQERLQERIRVENELRDEKNKLLTVIKEKESEVTKERSELTQRLQEHEQVIEVSRE